MWARPDDEAFIVSGRTAHRLRSRLRRAYGKALIATAMTPEARRKALGGQQLGGAKRLVADVMLKAMSITQRVIGHPFATETFSQQTVQDSEAAGTRPMWGNYRRTCRCTGS